MYIYIYIYIYISVFPTDLRPLHTESEIFACVFRIQKDSPSFPIKMHATDAKTQKIEPDPNFFDGRKFRRQCANVIDTT